MAWAPGYVTAADLKAYLRIPSADTEDDDEIALAIEGASRAVDQYCHRQFGVTSSTEVRYFTPYWSPSHGRWLADIDDTMTLTGMVIDIDTALDGTFTSSVTVADCTLLPLNKTTKGAPWTQIVLPQSTWCSTVEGTLRIEATWGWTAVPVAIEQATMIQATRLVKRRDSPFGVAGSPELGSEIRLLAKVDPDVAVTLRPFKHPTWGA